MLGAGIILKTGLFSCHFFCKLKLKDAPETVSSVLEIQWFCFQHEVVCSEDLVSTQLLKAKYLMSIDL